MGGPGPSQAPPPRRVMGLSDLGKAQESEEDEVRDPT